MNLIWIQGQAAYDFSIHLNIKRNANRRKKTFEYILIGSWRAIRFINVIPTTIALVLGLTLILWPKITNDLVRGLSLL